jgi:hypothetical protein
MTEYQIDWPLLGTILSGTIPITIAAIVAWVAVQQWITAKNKLALDLFDRRFAAWKALDAAFDGLMAKMAQEHEEMVLDRTGAGDHGFRQCGIPHPLSLWRGFPRKDGRTFDPHFQHAG